MIIEETCRAYAVGEATFGATVDLWDEVPEDVNEGIIHRGTIAIDRISEAAPTFDDVIAALYWGEDSFGEYIEELAAHQFATLNTMWRVEETNPRGGDVIRKVKTLDDHTTRYSLPGKTVAQLALTHMGELKENTQHCPLWAWYVLLKTVPRASWGQMAEDYKNNPPRELEPVKGLKWNLGGEGM